MDGESDSRKPLKIGRLGNRRQCLTDRPVNSIPVRVFYNFLAKINFALPLVERYLERRKREGVLLPATVCLLSFTPFGHDGQYCLICLPHSFLGQDADIGNGIVNTL